MKNRNFWFPKPSKIEIWRGLRAIFGESGGVLGSFRASWGCFGRALGESWHVQGRLGGVLGRLGEILGGFWDVLGAFWESLGGIFGGFPTFYAIHENCKKRRKTNGFSLIFEVPGEF